MRLFTCPNCAARLYFDNSTCLSCGCSLLYAPEREGFVLAGSNARSACANAGECGCNWQAESDGAFCRACALNQTIPDLSIPGNRERWARVEEAKRRLLYALLSFGLEVRPKRFEGEEEGIAFDFLSDPAGGGAGGERILTGHDNGIITLNVAEASSPERERMRLEMGEAYRTLIGHFRHEIGHYYWDRLIRPCPEALDRFRALFGDETADYADSLSTYYADGPRPGWRRSHISAYASSHPWEDWAESWAHYLHIADTLEMADAYRIPLGREADPDGSSDPVGASAFDATIARWLRLSEAANSINRCMGLPDLYPFVISSEVARKLGFVRDTLAAARRGS